MMSGRVHSLLRLLLKLVLRGLSALVLVMLALVLYFNFSGVPRPILNYALEKVNKGSFAVVVGRVELDGFSRVCLTDLEVYSRHALGAPIIQINELCADLSLWHWFVADGIVKHVVVDEAVADPRNLKVKNKKIRVSASEEMGFGLEVRHCMLFDISIEDAACQARIVGDTVFFNGITGIAGKGRSHGRVSGDIRYVVPQNRLYCKLVTNLNPEVVTTAFMVYHQPYIVKLLNRFEFAGDAPRGEWDIDAVIQRKGHLYLTTDFRMRNCLYRGVKFLRADGALTLKLNRDRLQARLERLYLERPEGMANLQFEADLKKKYLDFTVSSTLDPLATSRMVGVLTNFLPRHVEFGGPAFVSAKGRFDYKPSRVDSDFAASIKADDVTVFNLCCDSGEFNLLMHGRDVVLTNIEASAYDGVVSGQIAVTAPAHKGEHVVPYKIDLALHNADFDSFVKSIIKAEAGHEYQGRISALLNVEGDTGKDFIKKMHGKGSVEVKDGRVFMLPIFGGLSNFLTKVIPGLGFVLSQNYAHAAFDIKSGWVHTNNLAVDGSVLSLKAWGWYTIGGSLDFNAQVKIMRGNTVVGKFFRAVAYPFSKLFEFRVKGTVKEPRWYPVNFSRDIFKKSKRGEER